jgi:hypothetical protein
MKASIFPLTLLAAALIGLPAGPAEAAAPTRVFVAATGSDGNPCTFSQPCRTFQNAHDTVATGGEIDVLDPAGYGSLLITKAISIQGHGYAGVAANGTSDVITVNTGDPAAAVNLRGLLIDGVGFAANGIEVLSVGTLTVQDTLIRNFGGTGRGIDFTMAVTGTTSLYVTDTRIFDIGNRGFSIHPSGTGTVVGQFTRIEINNTGNDCLTLEASPGGGSFSVSVSVVDSVLTNAGASSLAVVSQGQTLTARITETLLAFSAHGYFISGAGATISTYGDNSIADNTANQGSLTSFAHQ